MINNHKKGVLVGVIAAICLVTILGVTYAIWNYSNTLQNQQIIAGDIYMKYTGTNQIDAKDMLPTDINTYYGGYILNSNMTEEELSSCESYFNELGAQFDEGTTARSFCEGTGTINNGATFQEMLDSFTSQQVEEELSELIKNNVIKKDTSKIKEKIPYFEFTIEGVNNYSKPIWYEIDLQHGEKHETRTERLRDDLLRFRLVEVVGEEEQEIFTNRGYEDLTNEKIYVNTIDANTKTKITRTYRLYMWISNTTRIGVGDNIDYDMETWNNQVYASIKVNVAGDFNEKEVNYIQPAYCFATEEFQNNGKTEIMITDYDKSCGTDVVIPREINGHEVTVIGDGFGNNESYIMPMSALAERSFAYKNLTSVVIPNTVRTIGSSAFENNNLTKVEIPDSVTWIDYGAFSGNPLEEVKVGSGIEYIGDGAFGATPNLDGYSNFQRLEIKKTCNEIHTIPVKYNEYSAYPWTSATNKDGLKVYGYEEGQIKLCDTIINFYGQGK